jgi:hypothetical protein
VFPVRYELNFCILFGRNSDFKGLTCPLARTEVNRETDNLKAKKKEKERKN